MRSRGWAVSSTATSCALVLTAAGSAARAADQAETSGSDQLQEVVVTGIRAAIVSAMKAKEYADVIEETISADDIRKLPDTTIAESLAQLPGLTTLRDS